MIHKAVAWLNVLTKVVTVGLAIFPLIAPELPQFQDKFLAVRSGLYPPIMFVIPAIWLLRGRPTPYPHLFDIALVMPFVLDMSANAANFYDTFDNTDTYAHFIITLIAVLTCGMVLVQLRLAKWTVAALAIGFGSTVHTLWELFEYQLMQMGAFGLDLDYEDTIQDMALGFAGSIVATVILIRWMWGRALVPRWLWRPGE